jgi:hypothetical protein
MAAGGAEPRASVAHRRGATGSGARERGGEKYRARGHHLEVRRKRRER